MGILDEWIVMFTLTQHKLRWKSETKRRENAAENNEANLKKEIVEDCVGIYLAGKL